MKNEFYFKEFIGKLSMPACAVRQDELLYANDAFYKAALPVTFPFSDRIFALEKIYRAEASALDDETELYIFNDISELVLLEAEIKKYNVEMGLAKNIQHALIRNSLPKEDGYEFFVEYKPSAAVGGDLFDAIRLQDGRILMYVADVSGHGISAAMMTVFFKQVINIFCKNEVFKFKKLVDRLNDRLEGLSCSDNVYLTLFIALLNTQTGQLKYFNAGHSAIPLIRRNDGRVEELYSPGIPICTWGLERDYDIKITGFDKGDRLVLYTDGVFPSKGYEEAYHRFKEIFADGSISCKQFIETVEESISSDEIEDDVLMMLCERK